MAGQWAWNSSRALACALLGLAVCTPEVKPGTHEPSNQELQEAPTELAEDAAPPLAPVEEPGRELKRFVLDEDGETIVWAVLDGTCRKLRWSPWDATSGHVLIAGRRVGYDYQGTSLELMTFSEASGQGRRARHCKTIFQLGEDGRLGESDLFVDAEACEAGRAEARPLDDSPERIDDKCAGEDLAVDTEEIECGFEGQLIRRLGRPGCLSVVAADLRADAAEGAAARP